MPGSNIQFAAKYSLAARTNNRISKDCKAQGKKQPRLRHMPEVAHSVVSETPKGTTRCGGYCPPATPIVREPVKKRRFSATPVSPRPLNPQPARGACGCSPNRLTP